MRVADAQCSAASLTGWSWSRGVRQLAGTLAFRAAAMLGSGPICVDLGSPCVTPVRISKSRISRGVAGGRPQALRTPCMTRTAPATIGVALDVPLKDLV